MAIKLTKRELRKIYEKLRVAHEKRLRGKGVKLPSLLDAGNNFTKDALVLIYLARGYPNRHRVVTKSELTAFVRQYYPDINDVQQARHLGAQKGWWVCAGGRDNVVVELERGEYQLYSLDKPYPGFTAGRRGGGGAFKDIKKEYGHRCATCGSEENQPHLHWRGTKTVLQKAHMDPSKPLKAGNIIPQCQKCNRADRNNWVYDKKGRVVAVANAAVIRRSTVDVKKKMLRILKKEFNAKK